MLQWYAYVPARVNANVYDAPVFKVPELKSPALPAIACAALSWLVHVTDVPAAIVRTAG
ncbi:MAG: hypothetical protein NVSMB22_14740 [Chloroflexota bacterium]